MNAEGIDNSPIEPAGDSRPIKYEALLEHEVELIRKANRLLRGMKNDNNVRQSQGVRQSKDKQHTGNTQKD